MISQMNNGKKVVGLKQVRKAVTDGTASLVWLALDADPSLTAPLAELCRSRMVRTLEAPSMKELGARCGISVGAAAAALLKD